MSKEKSKNKNLELESNLTYTNTSPIINGESQNGSVYNKHDASFTYNYTYSVDGHDFSAKIDVFDKLSGLSTDDLKKFYNEHNQSAKETYEYLINYIKTNKENPEMLKTTIDQLLNNFGDMYDNDQNHDNVGNNQEEILDKILNISKGEQLENFICTTIHEFTMKALQDAGINAAMIIGKQYKDGNHATLLYQIGDNKYIFNNYSNQMVIKAGNIKDAIREVYKKSGSLRNLGYIALQDGSTLSYQEFALREESVFGKEMDKRDYNSNTPFDNKIDDKSSIKSNVEISTQENVSAVVDGKFVINGNNKKSELGISLGYKNNNETSLFENSMSVGLKATCNREIKPNEDTTVYYNAKLIGTYTKGNLNDATHYLDSQTLNDNIYQQIATQMKEYGYGNDKLQEMRQAVEDSNIQIGITNFENTAPTYFSNFVNCNFGIKRDLVKNDKTVVTNATQASLSLGGVVSNEDGGSETAVGGDGRIVFEDGIQVKNKVGNYTIDNTINAGVVRDAKYTSGKQRLGTMFGTKLNASTGATYTGDNWNVGGQTSIYNVTTPSCTERGINVGFRGAVRTNSGLNIFGQANLGVEKQNLKVAGFHQETENKLGFNTAIGMQINPTTTVSVGYSQTKDRLNSTRNNNSFSIGVKVNL